MWVAVAVLGMGCSLAQNSGGDQCFIGHSASKWAHTTHTLRWILNVCVHNGPTLMTQVLNNTAVLRPELLAVYYVKHWFGGMGGGVH